MGTDRGDNRSGRPSLSRKSPGIDSRADDDGNSDVVNTIQTTSLFQQCLDCSRLLLNFYAHMLHVKAMYQEISAPKHYRTYSRIQGIRQSSENVLPHRT